MKNLRLYILGTLVVAFLLLSAPAYAQEENPAAGKDTLGSALLYEFSNDYDLVFLKVKTVLTDLGYLVNYASKKRNLVETDFKQFATEDTFHDVMNLYGDVPYMRSPGWTIGRAKISVSFEAVDSVRTGVKILAQMSGFEARFTNIWHYWGSNGKLEQEVMAALIAVLEGAETSSSQQ